MGSTKAKKNAVAKGDADIDLTPEGKERIKREFPAKSITAEQKKAAREVREFDKSMKESQESFDALASGRKDVTGVKISWSVLPPILQVDWAASKQDAAAFARIVDGEAGLNSIRRGERLAETLSKKGSLRPNDDLGAAIDETRAVISKRKRMDALAAEFEGDFDTSLGDVDPDAARFLRGVRRNAKGIDLSGVRDNKALSLLDAMIKSLRGVDAGISKLLNDLRARGATTLSQYTVEFGDPRDEAGNPVGGMINHTERKITLASKAGGIAMLHELFHAVVDNRMRSNPDAAARVRKAMQQVKDRMPESEQNNDAFEDEFEFINYYFTIPEFRKVADRVGDGATLSAVTRILNLVKTGYNALAAILGAPQAPLNNPLQRRMEQMLSNLLAQDDVVSYPASESVTVPETKTVQFMRSTPDSFQGPTNAAMKPLRGAVSDILRAAADSPITRVSGSKANRLVRRLMTIGDIVRSYSGRLPELVQYDELRTRMEKMVNDLNAAATPLYNRLKAAVKNPAEMKRFVDIVNDSTLEGFRLDEKFDSKGNAASLARTERDLDPKARADFTERRSSELQIIKEVYAEKIDAVQARMDEAAGRAEFGAKKEVRAPFQEQIQMLRAERTQKLKDVRAKFDAELEKGTKEQVAKRRARFDEMQARFKAMPAEYQKLYTDTFEHYAVTREREYRTLLAQAMRQIDVAPDAFNKFPDQFARIEKLREQMASEENPEKRDALAGQIRDITTEFNSAETSRAVRQQVEAILGLRSQMDAGRHAYVPLMRFGKFLIVARSQRFLDLEKKIGALEAKVEQLESESPELQEARRLQARVQERADELSSGRGRDSREVLQESIRQLERDIRALERKAAGRASPLANARLELNQARYELKQARRNGDDYTVQYFESEIAAEKALDILKSEGLQATKHLREDYYRETDAIGSSVMARLRKDERSDPGAEEFNRMLTELYLSQLPESNALKRRMRREGIAGFSTDMLQVFAAHNRSHAFFVSRIEHSDLINDQLELIRLNARKQGAEIEDVYNVLKSQHVLNMTRADTPVTDLLARMGAFFYLAITPAFVALNLSQSFMTTWPVLAARFNDIGATGKEMIKAMGDVKDIYKVQFRERDKGLSVMDFEVDFSKSKLPEGELGLIERMQARGLANFTQTVELADRRVTSDMSSVSGRVANAFVNLERMGWFLPHHTEVLNRVAAALTAYRQGLANGMTPEQAEAFSIEVVQTTHGDYAESNKPELVRKLNRMPGGKLLTLFKSYQQMMVMLLMSNVRNAFFNGNLSPEEKAVARRTLTYLFGVSGIFAGAMGVPGFAILSMVANAIAGMFGDEDEPFDFNTEFRSAISDFFGSEFAGEIATKGVLRALPLVGDWDLSSRVGAGNIFSPILLSDNPKSEGRTQFGDLLISLTGPVGGIMANAYDANQLASEGGDFADVAAMVVPKAMADVFRAYSLATDGATTRSGAPLYEPGVSEIMGQVLGFRPSRSAESGEMRLAGLKLDTQLTAREDRLKADYRKAVEDGDVKARRQVEREAREFYRKHRDRGSVSELRKSLESRARRDAEYQGARRVTETAFIEDRAAFGNVEE